MIMHKTLKDIQHNINNSKLIHPLNTSRTKNAKDSSLHKFSQIVYFIQMFAIVQLTKLHISFNVFEINGNYREKNNYISLPQHTRNKFKHGNGTKVNEKTPMLG